MKKRNFFRWLMVVGLVILMSVGCGSSGDDNDDEADIQSLFESEKPDEVMDDWELYKEGGEPIDISTDGTVSYVSVGAEDYVPGEQQIALIKKKFEGAIGMTATINISETNTMGGPTVGIRGQIARNRDGNSIRIELRTDCGENGGMHGFYYQIKEKDDEGNTLGILKEDSLGEPDGMWSLGEDFTLGVLYMGSEIWCYTPYSIEKIYEIESPVSVGPEELGIFAWGQAWGYDFLEATVSNVRIIYPQSSEDTSDEASSNSGCYLTTYKYDSAGRLTETFEQEKGSCSCGSPGACDAKYNVFGQLVSQCICD
jgi:hypothetical protein